MQTITETSSTRQQLISEFDYCEKIQEYCDKHNIHYNALLINNPLYAIGIWHRAEGKTVFAVMRQAEKDLAAPNPCETPEFAAVQITATQQAARRGQPVAIVLDKRDGSIISAPCHTAIHFRLDVYTILACILPPYSPPKTDDEQNADVQAEWQGEAECEAIALHGAPESCGHIGFYWWTDTKLHPRKAIELLQIDDAIYYADMSAPVMSNTLTRQPNYYFCMADKLARDTAHLTPIAASSQYAHETEALKNITESLGHIGFYRQPDGTIVEYFELCRTIYSAPIQNEIDPDPGVRCGATYVCKLPQWGSISPGAQVYPSAPAMPITPPACCAAVID